MAKSNRKSSKKSKEQLAKRKKKIMTGLLVVIAVGALGAGSYMTWLMTPPGLPSTPAEAIAMMKSARYQRLSPQRKEQYQMRMRELMEGMEQEQRGDFIRANMGDREVRREVFGSMRAMMEKRTKEFAAASPEDRLAILDADIDRIVAMRDQFQGMRGGRGGPGGPEGRGRENMSDEDREKRREQMRERMTERGQQRAETGNPQSQALRTEYRAAMDARMKQRGIEFGGRGGGKK
ncbi:hypothetical protein KS4_21110 [Poriferisphaera corsica]|uniref:Uncharacterized protein n=1 Tax=Poriferisphaera corsica TaxID=2528020 RepID=A0A517YUX4_9BACT|nr:hypothetical protein [Poriferisphaera corsica]QDU34049.1 hypothetical protein KS4_21110 [Poriferisphaera corsica]